MSIIKLDKVSKFYSKDGLINVGLSKISLEFEKGEFVAITGASGSGKSTLSNVISGIDTYEAGELFIEGHPTSHMTIEEMEKYAGNYVSFIFQNYNIIENYTVYQNIELALLLNGFDRKKINERCIELVEKVGLKDFLKQKASKLSGGQQQRVVIARALATGSDILIADEPTGNLDEENSRIIVKLLHEISKEKLVLVVSHDYEELEEYVTRKIRLMDGKLVEDTKVKEKNIPQETSIDKVDKKLITKKEIFNNGLRNVLSIPKVTFFKLTLFLFLMIGVSATYGNFANVNYSGYVNPQEGYEYGDLSPSRLIVSKKDGAIFENSEINEISSLEKVKETLEKSTLLNLQKVVIYPTVEGQPQYYKYRELYVTSVAMLDESLIIEGTLPKAIDEIVITYDESFASSVKVGDKVRFTEEHISLDGSFSNTITKDVKVVGFADNIAVNDVTKRVYLTKEFINNVESDLNLKFDELFLSNDVFEHNILNISQSKNIKFSFINDSSENYLDLQISYNLIEEFCRTDLNEVAIVNGEIDVNLCIENFNLGNSTLNRRQALNSYTYNVVFSNISSDIDNEIKISVNDFNEIFNNENYKILNLITKDYRDSLEVKKDLESKGYLVVYPFDELDKEEFISQRNMVLVIFIGISLLLFIVSIIVLTMILKTKEKRYIITRSMGATKKNIKLMSFLELLIVAVGAVLLITVFVIISKFLEIPFFSNTYQHFGFMEIILIIVVLLLTDILLINLRISKMVFNDSINMALRKL